VSEREYNDASGTVGVDQSSAVPSDPGARDRITRPVRIERWFEVTTAIILAVVAVSTAWSIYQATRWAGVQSTRYAEAAALRVASTRESTLSGQLRLYDTAIVNNWFNAHFAGISDLEDVYVRRMRPEFRPIFDAWLALDPFANPDAPPGPLFMPQYPSSLPDSATDLDAQAESIFDAGQEARDLGDGYVLNTVVLAMVLFLTTISEGFKWNALRACMLVLAVILLLFGAYHLVTYPIA